MVTKDEKQEFSKRLNAILDEAGFAPKGQNRQGLLGKEFDVSQKGARKWLEGEAIPAQKTLVKIADRFKVKAHYLRYGDQSSLDEEGGSHATQSLPEYTMETAPVCTSDYILFIEGNTAVDYEDDARFHCVPYEDEATWKARFLLFRKPGDTIPVLGEQHGSRHRKTHLSELVGGRRVDHPDLLHPLDSVEVLCAIRDVVTDSGLWDDG